jgi:hypothetical protein
MKTTVARAISVVFYPSLVLFAALMVAVYPKFGLSMLSLAFALIIPIVLSAIYFYYSEMPETWVVPREFRYFPLLFSITSNIVLLLFFEDQDLLAKYITVLSVCVTTFCLLITFYWKISLHMAGMGAIAGFFYLKEMDMKYQVLWVLASIFTAWARIFLKSHDIWQVLAGFFSSFIFALICERLVGF